MPNTTAEMQAELVQIFARFDRDADGLINEREFRQVLRALGEDSSEESVSRLYEAADADGDGTVGFEEFVSWWLDYN